MEDRLDLWALVLLALDTLKKRERVLLVGAEFRQDSRWSMEDSLKELSELVDTAGGVVAGQMICRLKKPHAAMLIGSGKAAELAEVSQEQDIDIIIFDDELSPVQVRNLSSLCQKKVIDRSQLILDIFSRRARTKEAQIQVELAQLQYLRPRLTGQWLHLSRQEGGIGTRGPGETQLEVDKRRVSARIMKLKEDLNRVKREKDVQSKKRLEEKIPVVSIIGYTNAGKTTLFNRLSKSSNLVENRLFATLDTTVRQVELEGSFQILLSDTVGFIRKLPHHLVESFKTTLSEATTASVLLIVVDVNDPLIDEKYEVVSLVLSELGCSEIPKILVLNKIDLIEKPQLLIKWLKSREVTVPISAKLGDGMGLLTAKVAQILSEKWVRVKLVIPFSEGKIMSQLRKHGRILKEDFLPEGVSLEIEIPPSIFERVSDYRVNGA